jgi:phenylalanyl-tRNA synthetase beta chain
MVEALRRSGIRSLGPIVDVTNYVLLELGQPMHAFDLARSRAASGCAGRSGERMTLLDGREIEPDEDMLLIADHDARWPWAASWVARIQRGGRRYP